MELGELATVSVSLAEPAPPSASVTVTVIEQLHASVS